MYISDYKGNQIRVEAERRNSNQLVVFYPGYAYTLKAPIFFYLQELFTQKGFDILGIDYRYNENAEFLKAAEDEKDFWFVHDCIAIGKKIKKLSNTYSRIIYIGKSLGTTMLMHQLGSGLIIEKAELVFLTPGTYAAEIYTALNKISNKALIVYGAADKHHKREDLELVKKRENTFIKEIAAAGHVFEEEGNIKQSIMNLMEVIEAIDGFIG